MPKKKCEYCGDSFDGKKKQRFCSRKCVNKYLAKKYSGSGHPQWKGGKVEKRCDQCGNSFLVPRCREKEKRFCSRQCYNLWRKGRERIERITLHCKQCGESFQVTPGQARTFCSPSCYWEWNANNLHGELHPKWLEKIVLSCEQCGKEFLEHRCNADTRRFCSQSCYGQWRTANLSGENSPAWLGGISFEPYTHSFNRQFKEAVRKRDRYTCAICKLPGKSVHHINYVKTESTCLNCITLCKHCHGATNTNRTYWQAQLTALVWIKELNRCQETGMPTIL